MISINNVNTDTDGRQVVRPVTAGAGSVMYFSGPTFTIAKDNSGVWAKSNPEPPFVIIDRTWCNVTLWDANGLVTTVEEQSMFTCIDLQPNKNIELIGGTLNVPPVLPIGNGDSQWRVWAYAAPKVPAVIGGQIPFFEDIHLENFYEGKDIFIDGRTPKLLSYIDVSDDPTVQSIFSLPSGGLGWYQNHIRFIFKHPTGLKPSTISTDVAKFQLIMNMFIKW